MYALGITLAALWYSQFFGPFAQLGPMLLLKENEAGALEADEAATQQRIAAMLRAGTFHLVHPAGCPPMPPVLSSLV
jgi:hypothetical protein